MELHIQRYGDGQVSRWVADELKVYDVVGVRGPLGNCHYRPEQKQTPLVLLATGTGVGAALAVAREAQLHGHEAPIRLLHGAREEARLYLQPRMRELAASWSMFEFTCCCSAATTNIDVVHANVSTVAFSTSRTKSELFLFGSASMVEAAHELALMQGVSEASIHADAFVVHQRLP
jgi:ferredoxin-NADP reductase